MNTDLQNMARQIFGMCGSVAHRKEGWRCGFNSYYGFHMRGSGATAEQAIADAEKSRLPDDPSWTDQTWVPGSYVTPFEPYVARQKQVAA